MRAFISDSNQRNGFVELADILPFATVYAPKGGTLEREQTAAEHEARAILAETEPGPSPLDGWAGHVPPHNDHTRTYAKALAEALAAFLEQEF